MAGPSKQDYISLNNAVDSYSPNSPAGIPQGWEIVGQTLVPGDGFAAAAYKDTTTGQVVIAVQPMNPAVKGTPLYDGEALGAGTVLLGNIPDAFADAANFYESA